MPAAPKPTVVSPALIRLSVAVAVAAILVFRLQHGLARPQFWAEDGGIFYAYALIDAPRHGASLILAPYAGYLHLIPRLIACASTFLPALYVPAFYAWTSIAVAALVAWAIQSPRIALPGKWAAALAIAAVPHTGECYGSICNLQWITALLLLAILLAEDGKGKPRELMDVFGIFVAGLTGPFVLLFMPLFAARVWSRRSRQSVLLFLATVATGLVQVSMLVSSPRIDGFSGEFEPLNLAGLLSNRLVLPFILGRQQLPVAVSAALGATVLGCGIWALGRYRTKLPGAAMLGVAALVILAVSCFKLRLDRLPFDNVVDGDRYFFTARIIVVWLIAAGAAVAPRPLKAALLALLVVALVANAKRFVYPPAPDLHWPEYAARIERGEAVQVPILPKGFSFTYPGRTGP